jgi:hypothetical protein
MTTTDHRPLAVSCFNRTWDYLDQLNRTVHEDLEMIHCAHASRYHWGIAGGPLEWARGEWQISRVYAVLHRGDAALIHAEACLNWVETHHLGAFDEAFAHEALARAYRELGQAERMRHHKQLGAGCAALIENAQDRAYAVNTLESIIE